ncbi:MAG: hypothetical protein RLZZ511_1264 [Cyanobacteriota bacterium]
MVQPPSSDTPKPPKSDRFINPRARYRGKFTPEHLAFNANLQEFAQRVGMLCSLETAGKIPPEQTYKEIKKMWKELKASKKNLLNDRPRPELPED